MKLLFVHGCRGSSSDRSAGKVISQRNASPGRRSSRSNSSNSPLIFRSLERSPIRSSQSRPSLSSGESWSDDYDGITSTSASPSPSSWQGHTESSSCLPAIASDTTSYSSASSSSSSGSNGKRSRAWSFRQAIFRRPNQPEALSLQKVEIEDLVDADLQTANLSRLDRRRAAVRQLFNEATSGRDGGADSKPSPHERFPIVSSRHWTNIETFNECSFSEDDDDDSYDGAYPAQERQRCSSVQPEKIWRVSPMSGPAYGLHPQRPNSAPPKRTLAVSFDDAALQIRCVTPDPCLSSDSGEDDRGDPSASSRSGGHALAPRGAIQYSKRGKPASLVRPLDDIDSDGHHYEEIVISKSRTKRSGSCGDLNRITTLSSTSSRRDISNASTSRWASGLEQAAPPRPKSALANYTSRIVQQPHCARKACNVLPRKKGDCETSSGWTGPEASREVNSTSKTGHGRRGFNDACSSLAAFLTANRNTDTRVQSASRFRASSTNPSGPPLPHLNTELTAIEAFNATKLSHLSVSAGDRLWAELSSSSQLQLGWVWCYSTKLNKMGYLPTRCVQTHL